MNKKKFLFISLFLISLLITAQPKLNVQKLKTHIKFLSSQKLKGRLTGTQQELTAANYIAKNFKNLGLTPKGNISSYFYSFKFKMPRYAADSIGGKSVSGINVVGFLDNHREKTIIISAHYDHLGTDGEKIFYGANDNASGVAGLIELARYFSGNKKREKFNVLFVCFSGNEQGLKGSKVFCEKSTIDLANVSYAINMDAIGRLNEKNVLDIFGLETLSEWDKILTKIQSNISVEKKLAIPLDSDCQSFYQIKIPGLVFSTGKNSDIDDDKKINFDGEILILEYIIKFIEETELAPEFKF